MQPCVICHTFDGADKTSQSISLHSTKYGPVCSKCIVMLVGIHLPSRDLIEDLLSAAEECVPIDTLKPLRAKYKFLYGQVKRGE